MYERANGTGRTTCGNPVAEYLAGVNPLGGYDRIVDALRLGAGLAVPEAPPPQRRFLRDGAPGVPVIDQAMADMLDLAAEADEPAASDAWVDEVEFEAMMARAARVGTTQAMLDRYWADASPTLH